MDGLFHFPAAQRRDPAVAAWLDELDRRDGPLGELARRGFDALRAAGDDVTECLHDGMPTACAGDAAFAYVNAFSAHVNVGFFRGAELPDPAGLLVGTGRFMRHVKLRPDEDVDDDALAALIRAAHADMRRRLEAR